MPMLQRRGLLLGLLLLAPALAGCVDLPLDGPAAGDGGGADGTGDLQPGPVTRDDCEATVHDRNYVYNDGFPPRTNRSDPRWTLDRVHCWTNWNQTEQDPAPVYLVFARGEFGGTGEWEATVYDAAGDVFLHRTFADPAASSCNDEGIEAPMGNWTVIHELRNFTGRLTARLCLDPPPGDCFQACP